MKKSGTLIRLFLLLVGLRGFALDIYVNDILWQSYSGSDLSDLRVNLSSEDDSSSGIPFSELIPLMSDLESLRIGIPGGEILLETDNESLRGSLLLQTPGGDWDLALDGSLYHAPVRMDVYGAVNPAQTVIIWAEPGLAEFRNQLDVWSSLHKIDILYREIPNIRDELIHSKMTGDLMPDFVLRHLAPDEAYNEEHTLAFILESILAPRENRDIDTLVLPSGFKTHPDLYLSILASLSDRDSPFSPALPNDRESHRKAVAIFAGLILNHRIMELQDYHTSTAFREGNYAFFPAGDFPLQTGRYISPGELIGLARPLSSRVYPLMLVRGDGDFAPGTLLDFLKLPGIQYKLFSLSRRQLPSDRTVLNGRVMTDEEMNLLQDWKQGYILSLDNHSLSQEIFRRLPDLLRVEGGLP